MAYSAIEQRYVDLLTTAAFPDAVNEPEPMAEEPSLEGMQLAAGPSATRTDAPQSYGEIRAVQPTRLESALQTAGVTLEQIGRFVDGLGQVDVPGLGQMSLADLLPFVGSAKEGTRSVMGGPEWQGTPKALQAPAEGKPLVTGTGQTLQLSKDAKLAAFDVLPAAEGLRSAAKGVKTGITKITQSTANKARQTFIDQLDQNFENLVKQYSKLDGTNGGRILNTDDARELSSDYRKNRSLASAVQDPASDFVERVFEQKLSKPTPQGFDSRVLILGSGGGSGKSSGRKKMGSISEKSEIVYDTTLSNLETAQNKVEQALKAGREVVITYTARDPIEAFYGVLERAMRQEAELGSGRTVPLEVFARQHPSARSNIDALANIYAENPNVKIIGIDNTFGIGNAKVVSVSNIPKFDYNGLEEKLHEILRQEYQAGRISDAVYRGTLDNYRPKQPGSQDRPGIVRQPERDGSGAREGAQQSSALPQQVTGGRRAPKPGAQ